jgi:hypothetical protein
MFAAFFVLPNNLGAPVLVEAVDEAFADVKATCSRVQTERVLLSVPAFRVETGAVSLRGDLESLGVKTCFTPAERLERMTADGTYASDVVHSRQTLRHGLSRWMMIRGRAESRAVITHLHHQRSLTSSTCMDLQKRLSN